MKRFPIILLLGVAALCFWQAGRLQQPLVQMRRDLHLSTGEPLENTPRWSRSPRWRSVDSAV